MNSIGFGATRQFGVIGRRGTFLDGIGWSLGFLVVGRTTTTSTTTTSSSSTGFRILDDIGKGSLPPRILHVGLDGPMRQAQPNERKENQSNRVFRGANHLTLFSRLL
eukprot:scaffold6072_cov94-Amphora_coffeaeformis.AAC.3